ncbi:hypothetical protein TMM008_08370 [Pseudomonas sp. 008]|nr:hypothetical protein TMM008_08370 [Pseudomonas sp. 008]
MSLGHASDQFGPFERQAFRVFGFNDHQNAANGLHGRDLQEGKNTALDNYSCWSGIRDLMHINGGDWWSVGRPV